MKREIIVKEKCPSCDGTGVFVGMAERDGIGVMCSKCDGTGCHEFTHIYEEFTERQKRKGIKHIIETNPGICVGKGNGLKFEDFGGMSCSDWLETGVFPKKSEMRNYTCPAWWYQCANYSLKPEWDRCIGIGSFLCSHRGF